MPYLGFLLLPEFFHPPRVLPIEITCSGEFRKELIPIVFYGLCGIFGKIEMKKIIRIGIEFLRKYCVKQRLKEHFGLRRNYWYNNIMNIYRQKQTSNLLVQGFAMLMGPGGSKLFSPVRVGTAERGTHTGLR